MDVLNTSIKDASAGAILRSVIVKLFALVIRGLGTELVQLLAAAACQEERGQPETVVQSHSIVHHRLLAADEPHRRLLTHTQCEKKPFTWEDE